MNTHIEFWVVGDDDDEDTGPFPTCAEAHGFAQANGGEVEARFPRIQLLPLIPRSYPTTEVT